MPDWTSLRLTWEPRLLSILRVVVGLLFLEHGTAKLFDFPHQLTHAAYALFTLVPGLQGIRWWAVRCLPSACSRARSRSCWRAIWQLPISWRMRREAFSRC